METIGRGLNLEEITVQPVKKEEEARYRELMQEHHYLGYLPKIGETQWYIAQWQGEWVALISFSSPAWKCAVRDRWIGWNRRNQYDRLKLVSNNSRFLILPGWHIRNLGSRVLSLCQRRISTDWKEKFGHPLLIVETFVDPRRFHGTIYKAANWEYVGMTRGFRRSSEGYIEVNDSSKMVFIKPLQANAQKILSQDIIEPAYNIGGSKIMLNTGQMQSLPYFFMDIPDPRRAQGRRHHIATVLGIAAGAILCGMRGYKAISDWAENLGSKARRSFRCRYEKDNYIVPSENTIREVLMRVDPEHLDRALQRWNEVYSMQDESLAIDGKTMCNAIDSQGRQTQIMSVIGHKSKICYTQKKSGYYPGKLKPQMR